MSDARKSLVLRSPEAGWSQGELENQSLFQWVLRHSRPRIEPDLGQDRSLMQRAVGLRLLGADGVSSLCSWKIREMHESIPYTHPLGGSQRSWLYSFPRLLVLRAGSL